MDVWGLTSIREHAPKVLAVQTLEQQKMQLKHILKALKKFSHKGLKAMQKDYLLAVALYNGIAVPDHAEKKDVVDVLLEKVHPLSALPYPFHNNSITCFTDRRHPSGLHGSRDPDTSSSPNTSEQLPPSRFR